MSREVTQSLEERKYRWITIWENDNGWRLSRVTPWLKKSRSYGFIGYIGGCAISMWYLGPFELTKEH